MELLGFAFTLVPLLVIGLIVWGIVSVTRRSGGGVQEPGIGSVRRGFFYSLALVALPPAHPGPPPPLRA